MTASIHVPRPAVHPGDIFEISIQLEISLGYEIHTLDASEPMIPTRLELKLPACFRSIGEWKAPEPVSSFNSDGHPVYSGTTTFRHEIRVDENTLAGDYEIKVAVLYQACTERYCLRPTPHLLKQVVTVNDKKPPNDSFK